MSYDCGPWSRFIFRIKVTTEKIIYSFGAITANTEGFIKYFPEYHISISVSDLSVLRGGLCVEVLGDGGDVPVDGQQLLVTRQEVQARPQPHHLPRPPPLPHLRDGVQQGA